jgi:Zn finger protein HypA/HybF involved in hydrogenase expression
MRVRCGRCSVEFEVPGQGRYTCPTCGSVNQIGGQAAPPQAAPPPPPPSPPLPRVTCGACGYSFAVGDVAVAVCPNCSADVAVAGHGPADVVDTEEGP